MKKKRNNILWVVGIFYLIYIFLFLSKFQFNPSATIELSANHVTKYNAPLPPNLVVEINRDGYDGQFYYMIAADPWHKHIAVTTNWYQRILYPTLAHILSLGNKALIPIILLLINFVSIILGTYVLLLLLEKYKANLNLAYIFAFNVGILIAIIRDLPEPLLCLFIVLTIYYMEKKEDGIAIIYLAAALLTKEIAILFAAALLFYLLLKREFKRFLIYLGPLLLYSFWLLSLFLRFDKIALMESIERGGIPFLGIAQYFLWLKFPNDLNELYTYYSALPVLIFVVIQCVLVFKQKAKYHSYYWLSLTLQILFLISLTKHAYTELIDGLGRQAVILFLFSILFHVENNQQYNRWLLWLMILMSTGYFITKIIIFKPQYFIT